MLNVDYTEINKKGILIYTKLGKIHSHYEECSS